ncbi:MAG TPA: UvrD-helicase domain-containing protein [Gemmatimonadales bacterium]
MISLPVATARQQQAIEASFGPLLVLAGPGAGKTFCLIERIRYLIGRMEVAPERIVAVTFTNKAAGEIAHRLRGSLGLAADQVTRSTIHALCVQLLREHGSAIGLTRGFGIADEEYQAQVLRRAGHRYPTTWPLKYFSQHKILGEPLGDYTAKLFERYQEILEARGLLDFDDLVVRAEQLIRTRSDVASEIAARWSYILVDEAQDLNPFQYAILHRLARDHRNIFMVGDDEQSIFSWTGADPRVLRRFLNDYGITARPIVLDENRRCSREIFTTARRLVAHNPRLHEKELTATRESPWPVLVRHFPDEKAEAEWLLADLVRDREENNLAWGDFALLYRKHAIGEALEARLVEAGIPCQLAEGRALADVRVVKYLIAALRVIERPGDPILEEQFAKVVLPQPLYDTLRADAEQNRTEFIEWLRQVARQLPHKDEDGRKIRRCLYVLGNLPAFAERHDDLEGLIAELLSQRVGEYRTILEEHTEEITDPASHPAATELAKRLAPIRYGRGTVWLPRMGGAELGLAGLLREAGLTMVDYQASEVDPRPEDVVLESEGDSATRCLELFKALQLVAAEAGRDAFRDFVSVDVETTDNDVERCDVVELGAVRVRNGVIVEEFQRLVKPTQPVSPGSVAIHGYNDEALAGAPDFAPVWTEFRAFAGGDLLVAHNGHGFDFPVLRRLAKDHPSGNDFLALDTLPLAKLLHTGSRALANLAHSFGIETGRAHHALDDARTLASVFLKLESQKRARARKTSLVSAIDHLAVALALCNPAEKSEARLFLDLGKLFALARYSHALESYESERARPGSEQAPSREELIERLGGRILMERLRKERTADERYPAAMARVRLLLDAVPTAPLLEQLSHFLDKVALSNTRAGAEVDRGRVSLLTLHSTKGLEFSRVYIVGAEDSELPGLKQGNGETRASEVEEARRLLYVGMTRAMDRLVLTRVDRRDQNPTGGMRFLEEMDLGGVTAGSV